MFQVGPGEAIVILVLALIVLGPEKLPEVARNVGKVMGEFRRISGGFQADIRKALEESEPPASATYDPASDNVTVVHETPETGAEAEAPKADPDGADARAALEAAWSAADTEADEREGRAPAPSEPSAEDEPSPPPAPVDPAPVDTSPADPGPERTNGNGNGNGNVSSFASPASPASPAAETSDDPAA